MESSDIVPTESDLVPKNIKDLRVCIKLYLDGPEFAEWAQESEKAGIRRKGLKLWKQKPHGFQGEVIANTKGIQKFIKLRLYKIWKETELEREIKKRDARKAAEASGLKVVEV